jgi:hypothetical protein
MTTLDTEQLAALVAAKLQVVEIVVRLGRRQLELVEAGDAVVLLKLLAAKQTVLDKLQAPERQLDPFREQEPEARVWRSPAHRRQCQAQAERCAALLAEAMELEKRGEAAMIARRDDAAQALSAVQSAADARAAYAAEAAVHASLQVEG